MTRACSAPSPRATRPGAAPPATPSSTFSTGSSEASSGVSRARATRCACWSATAPTGSPGTCAGWRSGRPTSGSWPGACSERETGARGRKETAMIQAVLLAAAVSAPAEFHRLLDEEWEARLREEPLLASATGDHRYDDRLPSVAPADLRRAAGRRRSTLQRLQAIDRAGLDAADRISYDMLARELKDDVADYEFGSWQLPINADSGFHTGFAELPRSTTLTSTRDYQNYIARLRAFPGYVAQEIANMREGLRTGFT